MVRKSNANNVCIFPVKHPSPLNFFAITNVFKGLEEFFSRESQTVNDGTDYQGVYFIIVLWADFLGLLRSQLK